MEAKLFGRWGFEDVKVEQKWAKDYVNLSPTYLPHTGGRKIGKQFSKSKMNIIERVVNRIMRSGQGTKKVAGKYIRGGGNTGKKQKALGILEDAFEIIEKRTKKNPVQVLVSAILSAGPNEETTVIIYGGIRYHKAVDVSPQRRIDFAIKYITLGAFATAFRGKKGIQECLADEIMWAAAGDPKSYAIQRKDETERIAQSAR
jgi:small subunit ribosomal protein S7